MTNFVENLVALLVLAAVSMGLVIGFRDRLLWIASTRTRRVLMGGLLLVAQLLDAIVIASIDFGNAHRNGAFQASDVASVHWLIGLTAVAAALQTFVILHADVAEEERAVLEKTRKERDFQNLVSQTFLGVVSLKRKRFKPLRSSEELIAALKPNEQLARMIVSCWELINHLLVERFGTGHQLRVAYFRFREERMSLAHCYNGTSDECVSVREPEIQARLRFDHPTGCLAVAAAKIGANYLIPDTAVEAANPTSPFVFFDKSQAERVKSIAALPIRLDGDSPPHGVLMVDTDLKGFFDRSLELPLQQVIVNLAHRLHLEELVAQIPGVD